MKITERADASRLMALARMFPESWGTPPLDDEERSAWIFTHATEEKRKRQHRPQREVRTDTGNASVANVLRISYLNGIKEGP